MKNLALKITCSEPGLSFPFDCYTFLRADSPLDALSLALDASVVKTDYELVISIEISASNLNQFGLPF